APYVWSIIDRTTNGAKNGNWVNIDPDTGRLFGTPPGSVGNDTTAVRVRLTDANTETDEALVSWFVGDVPTLPFFDSFEGDAFSPDYTLSKGASTYMDLQTTHKQGGQKSLLFSSTTVAGWPLDSLTTQQQLAFADNPANWQGGSPDMSAYVGRFELTTRAADTKVVRVEFGMKMYSGSSTQIACQAAFEYSEDFGVTWKPAVWAKSNANGVVRVSSGSYSNESIDCVVSGDQDYFSFRVRSLVKFQHTSAIPTYVSIDNFLIDIPLQQTLPATLPAAQETAPYQVEMTSIGGQLPHGNWQLVTGNLPNGMAIQEIGGKHYLYAAARAIPTTAAGTYNFDVSVTDGNNDTATSSYSLLVKQEPPPIAIVNQPQIGSAGEGDMYSYTLSANGGLLPYTWELKSSNAAWLQLDTASGRLYGAVPAAAAGLQVSVTVEITDLIGEKFENTYSFDIVNKITVQNTTLDDASESTTYRKRIVVLGGTPPYSYSVSGGALPQGMAINALTGEIYGAPYRGAAGQYSVDIFIEDNGSQNLRETFTIEVLPATSNFFVITTPNTLPSGFEEVDFNFPFDATGGTPPYVWSAQPGSMPPGLTLNQDGSISGSPTPGSSKTYTVQLTVTDAMAQTAVQTYSIVVEADPTFPVITTGTTMPKARVGNFYVQSIKVEQGTAPFTWTITNPSQLPTGLTASPTGDSLV
ncbi:MAG: putative Ig domain-containing protein, partial [Planctomycetes bacterium]|nr:putative Ig domain-containing protein [Planctomycetota bacterium]